MASQRQLRVGEEIRHILANLIMRNDWPKGELSNPVTVTRVDISPDLQNAVVLVMPLGGLKREESMAFLTEMAPYMRKYLADHMGLRRVPYLKFLLDETFDKAEKMDRLLKSVQ